MKEKMWAASSKPETTPTANDHDDESEAYTKHVVTTCQSGS